MRLYSKKFVPCVAVFGLAMLAGCGDTYEVTEVTGMKVIAVGEKVPECTEDNVGEMIFVAKVSETYYCSGKNWAILEGTDGEDGADGRDGVNGEDGKNGENGKDGFDGEDGADGNDGSSCTAKAVDEGVEVSCGGVVVGTIKNGDKGAQGDTGVQGAKGETGDQGAQGAKGETGDQGAKGETGDQGAQGDKGETGDQGAKGVTGDQGAKGETGDQGAKGETGAQGETGALGDAGTGCSAVDKGNGVVEVTCGDDEPVSLYKAVCGSKSYDPAKKACIDGSLYSCGDKPYDPTSQICDTRDNQIYKFVSIKIEGKGYDEVWLAQNLNYNTNTAEVTNSWCGGGEDYTANEGDCNVYGRLYTWSVAMDSAAVFTENGKGCGYYKNDSENQCHPVGDVQGICPAGWHLPSMAEWTALSTALEDEAMAALKSSSGWNEYYGMDLNGTDTFGFAALPTGLRNSIDGYFHHAGYSTSFWSSNQVDVEWTYRMDISYDNMDPDLGYDHNRHGYAVRCIKN